MMHPLWLWLNRDRYLPQTIAADNRHSRAIAAINQNKKLISTFRAFIRAVHLATPICGILASTKSAKSPSIPDSASISRFVVSSRRRIALTSFL
ncbi:hypothetical protein H6G33_36320 [Calothrix sp. FACHB-1219]|uniref:hypothetical protein n=1 Tax=unclassified Calothrix TaxID=2619626 RepID=UPI001684F813|nr:MULTISPECIES: hypothetical protein [unclassified Calothrix]MBD2207778.1 hypothetical protein [Calothrix sp. FACHB-168]MBD2222398.1 hypothetical protein [Calothrix sp. FACHB-1219]